MKTLIATALLVALTCADVPAAAEDRVLLAWNLGAPTFMGYGDGAQCEETKKTASQWFSAENWSCERVSRQALISPVSGQFIDDFPTEVQCIVARARYEAIAPSAPVKCVPVVEAKQ